MIIHVKAPHVTAMIINVTAPHVTALIIHVTAPLVTAMIIHVTAPHVTAMIIHVTAPHSFYVYTQCLLCYCPLCYLLRDILAATIATFFSLHVLSLLFLIIISGLFDITSLFVCSSLFHNTFKLLLLLLLLLLFKKFRVLMHNWNFVISLPMVAEWART